MMLIGLVLLIMIFWSTSNNTQKAKQKEYTEKVQSAQTDNLLESEVKEEVIDTEAPVQAASAIEETPVAVDSTSQLFLASHGTESTVTLSNSLVKVDISTKGGVPQSAVLSEYKNQQGTDVVLFDKSEISLNMRFDGKLRNISTKDLYFQTVQSEDSIAVLRLYATENGYLEYTYRLPSDSYLTTLNIKAVGLSDFFPSDMERMSIDWIQNLRQQEKGFEFEQRYTTLTYKRSDKMRSKYLNVTQSAKSVSPGKALDWVAFKNQFFSTILIADETILDDARLSAQAYAKGNGYMKKMMAKIHVPFDPSGEVLTDLQFYLGPNDYAILKAAGKANASGKNLHLNRVIDLGWPVVREVNRFVIIPLFNLLSRWGINMGIVLLLLTLIIKVIVYPFTYKSYISSAKMRALKPYVEEINQKYPKPEDAMKKQQETMAVYSKYGVSPMGGCLPSFIQMPVWMALFFFVPNAIQLRQQSFLWATDLTGFDDIISWGHRIPLIGDHLSIFCVLFCATNLINTYFSMQQQQTAPGQEESMKMMKWMMYLMPVIFFFTFNNYSSGLNYYYFISALSSIVIMIYLRRSTDETKLRQQLEAKYEANRNDPSKSRGNNLMSRLEAMQKEQERLAAQQNRKK